MPTRTNAPIGAPCWTDLMTSDADAARAFYGEIFGWVAEDPNSEFGGYFNYQLNGVRVAGCMTSEPGAEMTNFWSTYLVDGRHRQDPRGGQLARRPGLPAGASRG